MGPKMCQFLTLYIFTPCFWGVFHVSEGKDCLHHCWVILRIAFSRRPWKGCCFWRVTEQHVVDMVAHARLCSTGGSGCGGGPDNVLDDFKTGSTELVAVLDYASRREEKKWMSQWRIALETWKAALEDQNWLTAQAKPTFFELESHACQSKWISLDIHVANIFEQAPQIPAFCLLASKISISNLSPLQGQRDNRLPVGFPNFWVVESRILMHSDFMSFWSTPGLWSTACISMYLFVYAYIYIFICVCEIMCMINHV